MATARYTGSCLRREDAIACVDVIMNRGSGLNVSGDDLEPIQPQPASLGPWAAVAGYFTTRLSGTASLATLFWRDMLLIGTILTGLSFVAVLVLSAHRASGLAIGIAYFSALPYNGFITFAVCRAAERKGPWLRFVVQLCAVVWFTISIFV